MPCISEFPEDRDIRHIAEIDRLTRMLCALCRLAESVPDTGDGPSLIADVPGLRKWWEQHKAFDRKREAQEKAERDRKRLAAKAKAKLSAAERKALGLPD